MKTAKIINICICYILCGISAFHLATLPGNNGSCIDLTPLTLSLQLLAIGSLPCCLYYITKKHRRKHALLMIGWYVIIAVVLFSFHYTLWGFMAIIAVLLIVIDMYKPLLKGVKISLFSFNILVVAFTGFYTLSSLSSFF